MRHNVEVGGRGGGEGGFPRASRPPQPSDSFSNLTTLLAVVIPAPILVGKILFVLMNSLLKGGEDFRPFAWFLFNKEI